MIQSGGFLGRLLCPLLKAGLPLMENVIQPLPKSVLIPLGLTAATEAADAGIHKKILGSGTATLIISNCEMEDIIKIIQALEDSSLLLGVSETIQNEAKEQKERFLSMLLGTLGASLLGNMLAVKGIIRAGYGSKGKGIIRAGYGSKKCLISPHPLTNFKIQKYYQNEPRFNGDYSRDNLHDKIKDGAYVINLDEYSDIRTHWIAFYALNNNVTYFDSFGVEHIQREIKIFIRN